MNHVAIPRLRVSCLGFELWDRRTTTAAASRFRRKRTIWSRREVMAEPNWMPHKSFHGGLLTTRLLIRTPVPADMME